MESDSLPTELILSEPRQSLGKVMLNWTPQPGTQVDFEGETYTVLERRHRYCLQANRYTLHKIALYVKHNPLPDEVTMLGDRIIIGDATCAYNAHSEIMRCGRNDNLYAFHICDWKSPTEDMLLDRGLMGEGCINVPQIRGWVEEAGFEGMYEVEIFSNHYWNMDQKVFLDKIVQAYLEHS